MKLRLSGVLLILLAWTTHADDMIVMADVVSSEPVYEEAPRVPGPCSSMPPASPSLGMLLRWDLGYCRSEGNHRVVGYRVRFRWRGQTGSLVMDGPPGSSVPLALKLN